MREIMLIQVDDAVINTDQIKYINIMKNETKLKIFFDTETHRVVNFPNADDLNRFLSTIGRERIFA